MITLDEIRDVALALPEVEEGTHFRLPSFSISGKVFVTVQQGETHAIVHVGQPEAAALADVQPDGFEVVVRTPDFFVGVRVDLSRVDRDHLEDVIGHAWRHRAPRRLVAAHPGVGDS